MADETDERHEPYPNLTGIVIITLPPPNNPSLGKTITAFTLSDNQIPSTTQSVHPPDQNPQPPQPPPPPPPPPRDFNRHQSLSVTRSFSYRSQKTILPILCVSLIALYLWRSISQEAFFQLRDDVENGDDHHKNKSHDTFLFPLYQKHYRGNGDLGDVELKLGGVKGSNEVDGMTRSGKIKQKSVSAASKIDSTGVIPVGGNIYLDG